MLQIEGQRVGRCIAERRALRVKDFCSQYGVSRSFTYKLIALGKLRTVRIGKRRLIPVDAAEALLQEGA
jgi:excisionase family DNA binding protein